MPIVLTILGILYSNTGIRNDLYLLTSGSKLALFFKVGRLHYAQFNHVNMVG